MRQIVTCEQLAKSRTQDFRLVEGKSLKEVAEVLDARKRFVDRGQAETKKLKKKSRLFTAPSEKSSAKQGKRLGKALDLQAVTGHWNPLGERVDVSGMGWTSAFWHVTQRTD